MMCGCNTGQNRARDDFEFKSFAWDEISAVQSLAAEKAGQFPSEQLWSTASGLYPARGTEDGRAGCVEIPFFGVPIEICWEIEKLAIDYPSVELVIKVTVRSQDVIWWEVTFTLACKDVFDPRTCRVETSNEKATYAAFKPGCDWSCLATCAPNCISCGTNYWCWARCALGCILRCCRVA